MTYWCPAETETEFPGGFPFLFIKAVLTNQAHLMHSLRINPKEPGGLASQSRADHPEPIRADPPSRSRALKMALLAVGVLEVIQVSPLEARERKTKPKMKVPKIETPSRLGELAASWQLDDMSDSRKIVLQTRSPLVTDSYHGRGQYATLAVSNGSHPWSSGFGTTPSQDLRDSPLATPVRSRDNPRPRIRYTRSPDFSNDSLVISGSLHSSCQSRTQPGAPFSGESGACPNQPWELPKE